jgi:hypothetical protein
MGLGVTNEPLINEVMLDMLDMLVMLLTFRDLHP